MPSMDIKCYDEHGVELGTRVIFGDPDPEQLDSYLEDTKDWLIRMWEEAKDV